MSQTNQWQKDGSGIFFEAKTKSKEGNTENMLKKDIMESDIDIQWLTNIVEPEQQRGPSENP